MADTIRMLRERMEAAAEALDFEEAKRLRDRISLMRGGATAAEAEQADVSGLIRQRPGDGLGHEPATCRAIRRLEASSQTRPYDAWARISTSINGLPFEGAAQKGVKDRSSRARGLIELAERGSSAFRQLGPLSAVEGHPERLRTSQA